MPFLGLTYFVFRVVASNYKQNTVFLDSAEALKGLQEGLSLNQRKEFSIKAFKAFAKVGCQKKISNAVNFDSSLTPELLKKSKRTMRLLAKESWL